VDRLPFLNTNPTVLPWVHRPDLCPLNAAKEPHIKIHNPNDVHAQERYSHRQEDVAQLHGFCDFPRNPYSVDRFAHTYNDYQASRIDSTGKSMAACYAAQTSFPPSIGSVFLSVPGTAGPVGAPGATASIPFVLSSLSSVVIIADGLASHGPGLGPYTPDGMPGNFVGCATVPSAPIPALIGSFDSGAWFFIGKGPITITNPHDYPSTLNLAINDCGGWGNNAGAFNVKIEAVGSSTGAQLVSAVGLFCNSDNNPYSSAKGRECIRRMQAAYCSVSCPEYGKVQGLLCNDSPHHRYLFRVCEDWTNGVGGVAVPKCPLDPNNLPWDDEPTDSYCDSDLLNVRASGPFEDEIGLYHWEQFTD